MSRFSRLRRTASKCSDRTSVGCPAPRRASRRRPSFRRTRGRAISSRTRSSHLVMLVERQSRYVILAKVANREIAGVVAALVKQTRNRYPSPAGSRQGACRRSALHAGDRRRWLLLRSAQDGKSKEDNRGSNHDRGGRPSRGQLPARYSQASHRAGIVHDQHHYHHEGASQRAVDDCRPKEGAGRIDPDAIEGSARKRRLAAKRRSRLGRRTGAP